MAAPQFTSNSAGADDLMRAIIFDWDLTLWNSWDLHLWLMNRTADALGLPRPDPHDVARTFPRPFPQILAAFFGGDQQHVMDVYQGYYQSSASAMGRLYPGIPELLQGLKDRGYRLAVFSDKEDVLGRLELGNSGVGEFMDYVLFLVDGRPRKPDPEGLNQVIAGMGVAPEDALYVGDGPQDVECAHRAGAQSGAALWGSLDRERVLEPGPNYRWDRVEGVLDAFVLES
ncbi:MAG: hypothetical protein BZY88_06055 [SAR202 cluster bacterium Io17-Chloro-G9]|nr:MAG: hypothetical protein BZY88_06055 [SAR202 cluster bacterium Io17-Chloro-G9]